MQILPLTQPSKVSGKIETRVDGASKIEKIRDQGLPPQEKQFDQNSRLRELKATLAENDISLNYSKDSETDQLVIKLVDDITGEAIRQIPNEVSLKLAAHIQGQFLDQKF